MSVFRCLAVGLVAMSLFAGVPAPARAQGAAPKLSRAQRALLDAVVAAVDRATASPAPGAGSWQSHVLRASNGAHYVALRALAPDLPAPAGPVVLYVRLARHRGTPAAPVERSAVREWLEGQRSDPLPMRPGGSMSVPRGEMPVGSIIAGGRDPAAESVAALRLLTLERDRAARKREDAEAERKARLAREGGDPSVMLPFEDFDIAATLAPGSAGGVDVRRSVTAGPGDYDVHIGWTAAETRGAPGPVHVLSHRLRLPPATAEFSLSDLIVADSVAAIDGAYPPQQQNAHPYATGALEVTPAAGHVLRAGGTLALVLQVINPPYGPTGKPDVTVGFQISRLIGDRTEPVGALPSQRYDATKLPVDFDVASGHPLFAAVRASLASFSRGTYRVTVTAEDHLAGRTATAAATFEVVGTPASLLREAPRLGQAFRREAVLTPEALAAMTRALTPEQPSPTLAAALAAAADGRFAAVLQADRVSIAERPIAQALRSLALYGLGDAPRNVAAQLQIAVANGAPAPPLALLQGAVAALSGDNAGAIAAWQQSREAGIDDELVATLLIDAYARQGDTVRAVAMARAALDERAGNVVAARSLAGLHLARNGAADALQVLDRPPLAADAHLDTQFLRLHALYALAVDGPASAAPAGLRDRFADAAQAYVAAGGPHAALVTEWRRVVSGARPPD